MKKIIISEKIKNYRKMHRLSQEEFGELLSVSAQAVSKWERDICYPDIALLPEIAKILSCSESDFFIEIDADLLDEISFSLTSPLK